MEKRNQKLFDFSLKIINGDKPAQAVNENQSLITSASYQEIIWLVDELWKLGMPLGELKKGVNKIINLFSAALLKNTPVMQINPESFLSGMLHKNKQLTLLLNDLKPVIKQANRTGMNYEIRLNLEAGFRKLLKFTDYYAQKEGIAFPQIERFWEDYHCVKLMWSMHDDIRRNLKAILELLDGDDDFDMKRFNRLAADLFFDMGAIRFREENILIPGMRDRIPENVLIEMADELDEFKGKKRTPVKGNYELSNDDSTGMVSLGSGNLSPSMIQLLINTLPLDISYVDENNKVRYFSEPDHRIFPRSRSVLGRDVRNCHPPESVHVVNRIIDEFKAGRKNKAEFYIDFKGHKVLITYFAVRDEQGLYKGVLEVVQDVEHIRELKGERRLLNWNEEQE